MTLKTAVVAPMPRVSESIAVIAIPGCLRSSRNENRRSCSMSLIPSEATLVTSVCALQPMGGELDGEIQTELRRTMLMPDSAGTRFTILYNEFVVLEPLVVFRRRARREWVSPCPEETSVSSYAIALD